MSSVGYIALLKSNHDFRRLWLSEVVSFLGDWFNTIALYTAVKELSDGTQAIAAIFVAKMLPVFLMTPLAGPLIDSFDRRTLMIATDVARAVCALGLLVAYWMHSLIGLIAIVVLMTCFSGIFIPTKTAVLPQITPEEHLGTANALSAGTWSTMLALGAAAGGVVTSLAGIELALLVDAVTFLVSAAILLPLRKLPPDPSPSATTDEVGSELRAAPDRSFRAGLRYLREHKYLIAIISLKPGIALGAGALVMLPVIGRQLPSELDDAGKIGVLYTARGLGALVGSLLTRRIFGDSRTNMRRLMIPGFALIAASYLGLSFAFTLAQAALAYFMAAVGAGTIWVFSGTLGQLESDNAFRGRVFALEWGALTLVMSVIATVAGILVDQADWSIRQVAAGSGLLLVVPCLAWIAVLVSGYGADRSGTTPQSPTSIETPSAKDSRR